MPTSYTSLLGLALPVEGELAGTWGDTVNNFITQYVDAAVAGTQTISGSQTAVTLSVTNGSSLTQVGAGATGSAQYQIINCTGNPATALTVTVPSASRAYLVLNNTTTNQTVTVKGAATTGVTVAAAQAALIAWNGTDFELVGTSAAAGDVTLNGTQTLTNKTIEAGVFTNGYTEEVATANTGTAYTIDLANGSVQNLTLTGNCVFTFPTATAGRSFLLLLKQDATGSRTATWPATVKWPGGTAPSITSTASRLDKFVFTADGTNWYGSNAGLNYTV